MSPYLTILFNWSHAKYSTHSNDCLMLDVPKANTEFGKKKNNSFYISVASTGNILQCAFQLNAMGHFKNYDC